MKRLPTKEEFESLFKSKDITFKEYSLNGVQVFRISSASTGANIFIPTNSSMTDSEGNEMKVANTWTSTPVFKGFSYTCSILSSYGEIYPVCQPMLKGTQCNVRLVSDNPDEGIELIKGSGIYWCEENEGADNPEQAGNSYDWDTAVAKFGKAKEITENKGIPGQINLPDREQMSELINNCVWTWKRDIETGQWGYNVKGPNGNKIFLPVNLYESNAEYGYFVGYYWIAPGPGNKLQALKFDKDTIDIISGDILSDKMGSIRECGDLKTDCIDLGLETAWSTENNGNGEAYYWNEIKEHIQGFNDEDILESFDEFSKKFLVNHK